MYAVSGGPVGGFGTTSVEAYDPASNSWSTETPLSPDRLFSGAASIGDKLYVVGGCIAGNCVGSITTQMMIFDDVTDAWSVGTPLPAARAVMAPEIGRARV